MFKSGDTVMFPGVGLLQIKRIDIKTVGGKSKNFYILSNGNVTHMAPTDSNNLGPLISLDKAHNVIHYLYNERVEVEDMTWNRRYRDYMEILATGEIDGTVKVFKSLKTIKQTKDLSFGERKMLDKALDLLASELSIVLEVDKGDILNQIDTHTIPKSVF